MPKCWAHTKGSRHNGRFRANSGYFGLFQAFRIAGPGPQNCPDGAHRTLIADLRPASALASCLHHTRKSMQYYDSTIPHRLIGGSSRARPDPLIAPRLAGIWDNSGTGVHAISIHLASSGAHRSGAHRRLIATVGFGLFWLFWLF